MWCLDFRQCFKFLSNPKFYVKILDEVVLLWVAMPGLNDTHRTLSKELCHNQNSKICSKELKAGTNTSLEKKLDPNTYYTCWHTHLNKPCRIHAFLLLKVLCHLSPSGYFLFKFKMTYRVTRRVVSGQSKQYLQRPKTTLLVTPYYKWEKTKLYSSSKLN